jgi:hypothetical protein
MSPKPIETKYKGHRFRSRLEARWAVFFDALGIPYEYEPEGYSLGRLGRYLPDFWLPEQQAWVEIKRREPTEVEESRMAKLASFTEQRGFIFCGSIPKPEGHKLISDECPYSAYAFDWFSWDADEDVLLGLDMNYMWCECPECGQLDIQWFGHGDRIPCGCAVKETHTADAPRLLEAYDAARSARFEHGERGGPG